MATVEFRYDPKNTAWFTANAAMVLKAGEPAYHDTTGLFKLGDGVTALSALSFLPTVSASTPTIQQVLTAGQVATTTIETTGFIKTGGTSSQFLKADGSVDSNVYGVGNALTTNPLSQFAATTSSQLAGVISDETGTGALVFGTSPTFTTQITTPLIVGGSAVNSVIQYKGTTGNGTSTVAAHQFLVGNNGATTALNIENNGNVYIPTGGLAVRGGFIVTPTGAGFELEYSAPTAFVTAFNRTGSTWIPITIRGAALTFQSSNNTIISSTTTGTALTFTGTASSSGAITNYTFTASANTNQTLGTNIPNFRVTGANKQWATGALATQYFNYFTANTVSFVGASTATNVYNLFVEAPIQGTNATITNNYAAGFDGNVKISTNRTLVIGDFTAAYSAAQAYYPLMVLGSSSIGTIIAAQNTSTNGASILQLTNDQGTKYAQFAIFNSTYTTQGLRTANTAQIYTDSAAKLLISNNTEINFIIGAGTSTNEIAKFVTGGLTFADAKNIAFNTTTGTKLGTATNQKISFWNATPIEQPTTAVAAAAFVANAGTAVNDASTFDGYTLGKVVKALRNAGLLA